ncbi:hypothetical protein K7432_015146 [Basidiobolus ranarum]|uniref:N-acetylgalactosaminide beta-1,3-galactosyltransferase n=1 Tax=Basidiobolus ranarum TaxID=34480 RepID=A0ABR2VNH5_9FUNG
MFPDRTHTALPYHKGTEATTHTRKRKCGVLSLRSNSKSVVGLIFLMVIFVFWKIDFTQHSSRVVSGVNSRPTDPKLAIFVLTSSKTFKSRGYAVMNTWGRVAEERGIPVYFAASAVGAQRFGFHTLDIPETDYEHIYKRTYLALEQLHQQGKYDWIMKVDDDTYVNVDELLGALALENPNSIRLLGHMDSGPITRVHSCFGGPGYILSRGLMNVVGPHLAECRRSVNRGAEDVLLADCIGLHKPEWFDGCLPFRSDVKDIIEDLTGNPVEDTLTIDALMQPIGNVSWMNTIEPVYSFPPPVRVTKLSQSKPAKLITAFKPPMSEFLHAPLLERFVGLPDEYIDEMDLSPGSGNQRHWHTYYNRYWSLSEAYTLHKVLPQKMYELHHFYQTKA